MASLQVLSIALINSWYFLFGVSPPHHVTSNFLSRTFSARPGHRESSALIASGHVTSKIYCAQWCLTMKPCSSFDQVSTFCRLYRRVGRKSDNSGTLSMFYVEVYGLDEGPPSLQSTGSELIFTTTFGQLGRISLTTYSFLGYSNVSIPRIMKLVYSSRLNWFVARTHSGFVVFSDDEKCCRQTIPFASGNLMTNHFSFDDRQKLIFVPDYKRLYVIDLVSGQENMISGTPTSVKGMAVDVDSKDLIVCEDTSISLYTYQWKLKSNMHRKKFLRSCSFDSKTRTVYFLSSDYQNRMINQLSLTTKETRDVSQLPGGNEMFVSYDQKLYVINNHRIDYMDIKNPKPTKHVSNVHFEKTAVLCIKTKN